MIRIYYCVIVITACNQWLCSRWETRPAAADNISPRLLLDTWGAPEYPGEISDLPAATLLHHTVFLFFLSHTVLCLRGYSGCYEDEMCRRSRGLRKISRRRSCSANSVHPERGLHAGGLPITAPPVNAVAPPAPLAHEGCRLRLQPLPARWSRRPSTEVTALTAWYCVALLVQWDHLRL